MRSPKLINNDLRVLLSWEPNPYQVPPIQLSSNQITLCTKFDQQVFKTFDTVTLHGITPTEPYDIHQFVREEVGYKEDFDLVIVTISGIARNLPYNVQEFGCPTVAIICDSHHGYLGPIRQLLTYLSLERYDYLVFPYCRQHIHWFYACGFDNVFWLPLITMTTVSHEFVETRMDKIAFVCGHPRFHPYRHRVMNYISKESLPIEIGSLNRLESAEKYSKYLASVHCSLNGDLALRNLEIVSAGGFLLTDKLSPQSGFEYLLKPKEDCDVYSSVSELVEKIRYYLNHPYEAIAMARNAYTKFFSYLHPNYRINELYSLIFNSSVSSPFLNNHDSRLLVSRQHYDLLEIRVTVYEQVQELHKLEDSITVLVGHDCPLIFAVDLVDLCRASIHIHKLDLSKKQALEELGISSQIDWIEDQDLSSVLWDIYIFKTPFQGVRSRFRINVAADSQTIYSDLDCLSRICLLPIQYKNQQSNLITYLRDEASLALIDQIFNKARYPILDFVGDVNTIVDIGAKIGLASAFFRANYPTAKIYSFEPDLAAFLLLQENARKLENCYTFPLELYSAEIVQGNVVSVYLST